MRRSSLNVLALLSIYLLSGWNIYSQSLSPQTINSAGDDYYSQEAIMNVSIGEVVYQTLSQPYAIINQGFQHPNLADFFQNITIPPGWSGISSFIIPQDSILDTIYAGFTGDTLMISNFNSLYIKGQTNSETNYWESNKGKRIKVNEEYTVKYYGERLQNSIVQLEAGWNILPILSTCKVSCDTIKSLVGNGFEMIINIGSDEVYWPDKSIVKLQFLEPGKAYYLKISEITSFQFPNCN